MQRESYPLGILPKENAILSHTGPRPCLCSSAEQCPRKWLAMVRGDMPMMMPSGSSSLLPLGQHFLWHGKSQSLSHCWDCNRRPFVPFVPLRFWGASVLGYGRQEQWDGCTRHLCRSSTVIAVMCSFPRDCRDSEEEQRFSSFQNLLRVPGRWGCTDSLGGWSWGYCEINHLSRSHGSFLLPCSSGRRAHPRGGDVNHCP